MVDSANLAFRRTCSEDETFLFQLYTSTRTEELNAWGWDKAQRENFLKMQFDAQQRSYRVHFPSGEYQILLLNGHPIGKIFIVSNEEEIRLIDIALLPEYRNRGIGTSQIQNLIAEAAQAQKPLRLQVMKFNRAVHLYERLGFSKTGDTGIHFLMEWQTD